MTAYYNRNKVTHDSRGAKKSYESRQTQIDARGKEINLMTDIGLYSSEQKERVPEKDKESYLKVKVLIKESPGEYKSRQLWVHEDRLKSEAYFRRLDQEEKNPDSKCKEPKIRVYEYLRERDERAKKKEAPKPAVKVEPKKEEEKSDLNWRGPNPKKPLGF